MFIGLFGFVEFVELFGFVEFIGLIKGTFMSVLPVCVCKQAESFPGIKASMLL